MATKNTTRGESDQDLQARLKRAINGRQPRPQIPESTLIAVRLVQMCT